MDFRELRRIAGLVDVEIVVKGAEFASCFTQLWIAGSSEYFTELEPRKSVREKPGETTAR